MSNIDKIPLVVPTNSSIVDNIYNVFERFREYIISNDAIGEDLEEEEVIFVGANDDALIFKTTPHNENLFNGGLSYDYKIKLPVNCFGEYTIIPKNLTTEELQTGYKYENLLTKLKVKSKYILNPEIRPMLNYYRIIGKEKAPPNFDKEFYGEICTITTFGDIVNVKVLSLDGTIIDHTYQADDLSKLTDILLIKLEA